MTPSNARRSALTLVTIGLLFAMGACSGPTEDMEPSTPADDGQNGQPESETDESSSGEAPASEQELDEAAAIAPTTAPEATQDTRFEPVGFEPMSEADCDAVAGLIAGVLGPDVAISQEGSMPFVDYHQNEAGQGCFTAASFEGSQVGDTSLGDAPQATLMTEIRSAFEDGGWQEDTSYAADGTSLVGAGGSAAGFRSGANLCLLSFNWTAETDAADSKYTLSVNCALENS